MDRKTVYFGQIPLETDQLLQSQNAMVALCKLAAGCLGTQTIVNGFTCTPTSPTATLNVIVTPGEVYQIENLEASAWSSLPADTAHTILKQGMILDPVTFGITPPGTVGFSQVFLIEAQYQDLDTGAVVLPYFNAANPSSPFSGPANSGAAQNTVRKGVAALQVKAGTAAATGTQVAPTADAGWVGLFTVTVANGATSITSGNIAQLTTAPFIPTTLPGVPPGVLNGAWVYAVDTGSANTYVASITAFGFVPTSLVAGMQVRVKIATTNTGASTFNLNGLGAHTIVRANGAALSANDLTANQVADLTFDGTNWQLSNYAIATGGTNNFTTVTGLPYCVDTGTVNNIVAPFSPAIASLTAGIAIEVKIANTVSGATTITVNALAAKSVVFPNGAPLTSGALKAGMVAVLVYDGTQFQLISSVDATTPLKVIELAGSGQSMPNNVNALLTCLTTIVRNTCVTTTWDGQNLTIGAGEDGLWSISHEEWFGDLVECQTYVSIARIRSGVTKWFVDQTAYGPDFTGMDSFAINHRIMDLQVGDVIHFHVMIQGPAGVYTTRPVGTDLFANSIPLTPAGSNVYAYRLSGLH